MIWNAIIDWEIITPSPAIQYPTWTNIADAIPNPVSIPSFREMRLFLITTIVSGPGLIAARSVIPMSVIYGSMDIVWKKYYCIIR